MLRSQHKRQGGDVSNMVKDLWQLLDDIDTLDDACKDNDKLFRDKCYKIQQKRWKIYNPEKKGFYMKCGIYEGNICPECNPQTAGE